jgi:hypothetical protein
MDLSGPSIDVKLKERKKVTTFQVVYGSTLNAGNPMDQFTLGSDLHLDDPLHPFFNNQKFFTGVA